jgi:hypothetical protein
MKLCTRRHSDAVLCVACLVKRWGCDSHTVTQRWRTGIMPAPFNSDQARGWLWNAEVIARYEAGASA